MKKDDVTISLRIPRELAIEVRMAAAKQDDKLRSEIEKAAIKFLQADEVQCANQQSGTRYADGGLDTRTIFQDVEGNECEVFWSAVDRKAIAVKIE